MNLPKAISFCITNLQSEAVNEVNLKRNNLKREAPSTGEFSNILGIAVLSINTNRVYTNSIQMTYLLVEK